MNTIYLVANGDARLSANQKCQEAQAAMEAQVVVAIEREGGHVQRAHPFDAEKGHGFIDGQKYGMEVFRRIPKDAPLVVAAAAWQYSQHILPGLLTHEGPILTIANWSGTWPGLVGLLNLNGSMIRAGIKFSSLWSATFEDKRFCRELRRWLEHGKVKHDTSHVRKFQAKHDEAREFADAVATGRDFARRFRAEQAIMGVFDEGCMGMYNAIIPDALLQSTGVFKERLSQAALYARMQTVGEAEARAVFEWYRRRGLQFHFGSEEMTDLTESQVLQQCRMYVATLRIADEFGCATIGIQYQQGLKDLTPASDLVEGSLNNVDRPPVYHEVTGEEILPGEALPHFNEVDECAGLDGLVTYRLWRQLGLPPENTLHDLRWGRHFADGTRDEYVWVFLISGAVPPEHLVGGWAGATSERQPPMYFRLGGGTIKGISKPGWIVWSRVFVEAEERLCYDLGLAEVLELPAEETEDRWQSTTPQWPIMHAVLQGISRDQMMARHASNHIQVVYAPTKDAARHGLFAKAAAMHELGLKVSLCGHV